MQAAYAPTQHTLLSSPENVHCSEGNINPLVALQHGAMYQQNLCRLMELVVGPTLQMLEARCAQNRLQPQFAKLAASLQQFAAPAQRAQHAPAQHGQHAPAAGVAAPSLAQLTSSMADLLSDAPGEWHTFGFCSLPTLTAPYSLSPNHCPLLSLHCTIRMQTVMLHAVAKLTL